jgi:uncharacterized protein YjbJ (UPF0337 family)
MNNDQVSGKVDQVVGKIKQEVGEAVGNDNLANRGVVDQIKGDAKEAWGNVKDAANRNAEDQARATRQNIADSSEAAKDRVTDAVNR